MPQPLVEVGVPGLHVTGLGVHPPWGVKVTLDVSQPYRLGSGLHPRSLPRGTLSKQPCVPPPPGVQSSSTTWVLQPLLNVLARRCTEHAPLGPRASWVSALLHGWSAPHL